LSRPEPLSRALKGALAGLDLEQRLKESQAMALWPDVVGEVTANKTRPLYVNRGTLVVLVTSSAWANQLNLLKPRLLLLLEKRVGAGVIRDLRWKTGALDDPIVLESETGSVFLPPRRKKLVEEPPLPPREQEAIARLARGVEDPRLSARFSGLLQAHARRRHRLAALGWIACNRCSCLHDPAAERAPGPLEAARLCPVCRLELARLVEP
jgi:hypothetical protein